MAVLAVLIPPLMLGLMLALGRYEELLLPKQDADRPSSPVTPTELADTMAGSPAAPLHVPVL
ncbi:hypothetical protein ABZ642_10185 [Streptomyces sp. NPDC007157]|uniref:hypothetical protein n=1 Tax=Streptomyces sp. NPDC007157 TaxID=3154681 RepID=UPI0033C0012B